MTTGITSLAVVTRTGAEPCAEWSAHVAEEPAFLIYSITKTILALLALQLCEQGEMRLDDTLSRWFPRVDRADRITMRHLLTHTAGVPNYGGVAAYHEAVRVSPSDPWTFDRFAAETFDRGLDFAPGQGWSYSNPGYMLLKRVVELTAGASFRAVVDRHIVRPLGLTRTFVPESVDDLAPLAPAPSRHLSTDDRAHDTRGRYHPGWVSHGVVASTAAETARILDALFSGQLMAPHWVEEMLQAVTVPVAPDDLDPRIRRPSYGLGLMIDLDSPWGLIAGHNGGGPGYTASAFHAFDLGGATVCVLAAGESGFDAQDAVFNKLGELSNR